MIFIDPRLKEKKEAEKPPNTTPKKKRQNQSTKTVAQPKAIKILENIDQINREKNKTHEPATASLHNPQSARKALHNICNED